MERPLWQIMLCLLIAGAAIQRGAVAAVLILDREVAEVGFVLLLESAAFLATAVTLWIGGSVALAGAAALGIAFAASGLLVALLGGPAGLPAGLAKICFGILAAAGLRYVVRRELIEGSETPGSQRS